MIQNFIFTQEATRDRVYSGVLFVNPSKVISHGIYTGTFRKEIEVGLKSKASSLPLNFIAQNNLHLSQPSDIPGLGMHCPFLAEKNLGFFFSVVTPDSFFKSNWS